MLKQQIQKEVTESLKSGNKDRAEVLRLALAAISAKEKEKRYQEKLEQEPELSDEEAISVLTSEIKKRRDAIALYEKGNRPELAEKEQKEIVLLQAYLPAQLSQDELRQMVQASIDAAGAKELKDMGKVMADLSPKIKGRAEGGEARKLVKELLTKK